MNDLATIYRHYRDFEYLRLRTTQQIKTYIPNSIQLFSYSWSSDLEQRRCKSYINPISFTFSSNSSEDVFKRYHLIDMLASGTGVSASGSGTHPAIGTPQEVSARGEVLTKDKMEATSTSTWETILNASKWDDANRNHQRAEEQQVEA